MSHQLVGKKSRFEIPPLDWKAPEAKKDADINSVPADVESTEDTEALHSSA
ncbi:hypothetical protein D9M68_710220 [compost metagenome]|uniref:Uncharacterized protein n=1 Tax=Achromobacter agilis TaxID=1353888 RepID=A0A446CG61_9BURK|nr:hypothetical protein [Achromobacter agilis]SSW66832.1 hypothetical protein AGI3411_02748 [Achromobacter agilis]